MTIVSDGNLDTTQLRIEQLLVGGTFTCILARVRLGFINRVRRLRCWGAHDVNNNTDAVVVRLDSRRGAATPPEPVRRPDDRLRRGRGRRHACLRHSLRSSSSISSLICMGMNFDGELGYGPLEFADVEPDLPAPRWLQGTGRLFGHDSGLAIGEGLPPVGARRGAQSHLRVRRRRWRAVLGVELRWPAGVSRTAVPATGSRSRRRSRSCWCHSRPAVRTPAA